MKVKNKKLIWNTLNYSWNEKKIINFNIFYQDYIDDLYKKYKKGEIKTKKDLKEYTLTYCRTYWGRVEYEIMVGDVGAKENDYEKIDVFRQVEMNIDRIVDYVNTELEINL